METARFVRLMLKAPKSINGERVYIPVCQKYTANFYGRKLPTRTVPSTEQSSLSYACASSAIWVATEVLRKKLGNQRYSPTQITEKALAGGDAFGRKVGLKVDQMLRAIRQMGYEIEAFGLKDSRSWERAKSAIYSYVESGFPALLLLFPEASDSSGHFISAIGHTLKATSGGDSDENNFNWSMDYVEAFLVHDDQRGPYRILKKVSETDEGIPLWQLEGDNKKWFLRYIIVPTPTSLRLNAWELLKIVRDWLGYLESSSSLSSFVPDTNLILRHYAVESNSYKQSLEDRGVYSSLTKRYKALHLPRWIWVVEFLKAGDDYKNSKVFGEVIFDGGASRFDRHFLSWHLKGKFVSGRNSFEIHKLPDKKLSYSCSEAISYFKKYEQLTDFEPYEMYVN